MPCPTCVVGPGVEKAFSARVIELAGCIGYGRAAVGPGLERAFSARSIELVGCIGYGPAAVGPGVERAFSTIGVAPATDCSSPGPWCPGGGHELVPVCLGYG